MKSNKFRPDITSRYTDVHEENRKSYGHFTRKTDDKGLETRASPSIDLEVPKYLQEKFEVAIRAADPELKNDMKFPLAKGVNSFHYHFEQVRQM